MVANVHVCVFLLIVLGVKKTIRSDPAFGAFQILKLFLE